MFEYIPKITFELVILSATQKYPHRGCTQSICISCGSVVCTTKFVELTRMHKRRAAQSGREYTSLAGTFLYHPFAFVERRRHVLVPEEDIDRILKPDLKLRLTADAVASGFYTCRNH